MDSNPFRYCGEYLDIETGTYYLRARYYDPTIGRFLTEDTTSARLMNIFDPYGNYQGVQLNGGVYVDWAKQQYIVNDPLSLNLYTYAENNTIKYKDSSGNIITPANVMGAVIGAGGGAALGELIADYYGLTGWKRTATITGFGVGGAAVGWFAGPLVEKLAMSIAVKMGLATGGAALGTQFDKLGTLVKNPRIVVDWANTTLHGLQRMAERGVTQNMVETWMNVGKVLQQLGDKYLYITQQGVVVVNRAGQVITAYGSKYFDANMQEVVKQLFGK